MKLFFMIKQARSHRKLMDGIVEIDGSLMSYVRAMAKLIKVVDTFCEISLINEYQEVVWSLIVNNQYGKWNVKEKACLETSQFNDTSINFVTKILLNIDPQTNTNTYYRYEIIDGIGVLSQGRINEVCSNNKIKAYMIPIHYMLGLKSGYVKTEATPDEEMSSIYMGSKGKMANLNGLFTNEDESVKVVINKLYNWSAQIVDLKYEIVVSAVSSQMLNNADKVIDKLSTIDDVELFNKELIRLFTIIPRRMNNVSNHLAKTIENIDTILDKERALLNNLKLQHELNAKKNIVYKTFNEEFGFKLTLIEAEEVESVVSLLNCKQRNLVKQVFKINCQWQNDRFNEYVKNRNIKEIKQLWHGSRNENWLSILKSGLQLHPNASITGKMFGDGIYFAADSDKSFNYTSYCGSYWANGQSEEAYMMLCDTAYGVPCITNTPGIPSSFNTDEYNCVHAKKGRSLLRDEIIFYDEAAIVPRYLVQFVK